MKKFIYFFYLVIVSITSVAQQGNIKFGHLGLKDGLSQSDVSAISQTKNGLLWFGTQDGLNSYNGYEFTVYAHDLNDSTSISNNYIHAILEQDDSLLWLGTENGLNLLNTSSKKFTNIFNQPKFHSKKVNVYSLVEVNNTLWVGADEALYKVNLEDNSIEEIEIQLSTLTKQLHVRKLLIVDNNLVIATEGNGLIIFNTRTLQARQYYQGNSMIKSNVVWDLHIDTEKEIAIATSKGVNFFKIKNKKITSIKALDKEIKSQAVKTIFEDKVGVIWIGTESKGLYKLKSLSNIDHYMYDANRSTSLRSNQINVIFEDSFGIIWIGTQAGINKFDKQKQYFKHHQHFPNKPNSISSNMVWSIFQDNNDNLLIGTDRGLNVFNRVSGALSTYKIDYSYTKENKKNSVYAFCTDHNNATYVGTDGGVFSFSDGVLTHLIDEETHQNEARTYSVIEDNDNNLWFATKKGLVRLDSDRKIFTTYTVDDGLSADVSRVLFKDTDGVIWIGTDGGGLCKLLVDKKGNVRFKIYKKDINNLNSISSNTILSIYQDENEFLWIGTFGGGLNKFDIKTDKFTRYTKKEGLSNNVIYGILEDKTKHLWLSTNKGISSFNIATGEVKSYDESDGLQSNEFNNGAFFKNKFGEMFFGGINGFNSFYPEDINVNTTKAKPIISNFYLFNKPVKIGENSVLKKSISALDEIVLKYKQNVISFEFASIHYSYPAGNGHKYMLENFDEDWVDIGNNRRANYTNLDAGDYIFKVKVSNSDGVWSDEVAQIRVTVEPPIWGTWWFRILVVFIVLSIIYWYYISRIERVKEQKDLLEAQVRERTKEVINQKELLQIEKDKTEKLLLNVLPAETAEELKTKGRATARQYRMTSIMFTDFKSFTKIAEKVSPVDLVTELDNYFKNFDEIVQKYDIEKIKTIGDAYMCAGGIPVRNKSNPIDIVLAGLSIQRFMTTYNNAKEANGEKGWELRIGIHTGPVIAGVVGIKRFAYDIWGDSVNIASRIEAAGNIGKVNISGATYELVKEFFKCEYRGEIKAKNKGKIDMYFVHSIKPELSVDGKGIEPNKLFQKYVDLHIYSGIYYRKAEKYIVERLRKELPENLHYHDLRHTTDVCAAVERLALMEGIEGDDIFLLKTAALYHDAGFVKQYANNEDIGAALAQEVLPRFGYSQEQIDTIGKLIQATKVPQKPNNHLEQIICDADLDYLGGDEFHVVADKLKRELWERDIIDDDKQWDMMQVKFLEQHHYFTKTAIELRQANKLLRIEEIKKRIEQY